MLGVPDDVYFYPQVITWHPLESGFRNAVVFRDLVLT